MKSESNNLSLLEIAEIGSVIGSVGGTVASLITQQFFFASIPLSVSVSLNLLNRRQLLNSITAKNQEQLAALISDKPSIAETPDNSSNLEILSQLENLSQLVTKHSQQFDEIQEARNDQPSSTLNYQSEQPTEIINPSEPIALDYQSATDYYKRGIEVKERDPDQAFIMFTEAINVEPQYADAYYQRALILSALKENKKAIEDLRMANKWYFQQGDLTSYQKAKEMEIKLHALSDTVKNKPNKSSDIVRLSNLFS
jgi:tetratricopeptide (TPR) repeat protein